jgi:formate hydrogenlyase subunit 3/multisubunit Na+/H+ antiporter MnhD subunit
LLQRRLLGVLVLVSGLFSLAGFPLTPGAAGRWPLIASLLASEPRTAWVLILAGAGVSVGTLVGLLACLGPAKEEGAEKGRFDAVVAMGFAFLALWLVVTFTLHPKPWLDMAQRMLGELTFLAM